MGDIDPLLLEMLADRDADLDPELEVCLYDSPFGQVLKHPLVFQVPFHSPGFANKQLVYKREALCRAIAEQDWHSFIWLHERPHRFDAWRAVPADAQDRLVLLSDVWVDSENTWQNWDGWIAAFTDIDRDERRLLMNDEEWAKHQALPERVTIYRGCTAELNEDGLAWTLDRDTAVWFANRLVRDDEQRLIITAEVHRDAVLALFDRRDKEEVIILPEDQHVLLYEEI